VGDEAFLKYLVCAANGWNPYSKEVNQLPPFYWLMAFYTLKFKNYQKWEEHIKPHAELVGHITNPEVYQKYKEFENKRKQIRDSKGPNEIRVGDTTHAVADSYYDPQRGLVNSNGRVIISKGDYERLSKIGGVAVSF